MRGATGANGTVGDVPDVSVIIATYRRTAFLCEALHSVLDQSASNVEIVVVDDAGEPDTAAAVLDIARNRGAIRYIRRSDYTPKAGGLPSRNIGTKLSNGRFVLFLDDDDLLAPSCLECRLEVLENNPVVDFCVGQCAKFQGVPKPGDPLWYPWTDDQDDLQMFLSNRVPWQTSGPLWRREALCKVGEWDESLKSGWDYEYHVRALAAGARGVRIPVIDYYWRLPRADSYSGFDAFKHQHRRGDHILAFCKSIDAVGQHGQWTPPRKNAAWREAIRLAFLCRLHNGTRRTAQPVLDTARKWGCGSMLAHAEASTLVAGWITVADKLLPLSYLARRRLADL